MPRAVLAALVVVHAVGVSAEAAAPPNKPVIRLNAADNALARAAVLRRADLGSTGWSGGSVKPDVSSTLSCPGYTPKQSDLVVTGAAETDFRRTGLQLQSVAELLKTRAMVARDWRRTVADPRGSACLRHLLVKGLTRSERLVSFRKLAFPRLTRYTAAYRSVVSVRTQGTTVPVLFDAVLVARGRTELTLTMIAPFAARANVSRAEVRLARGLLARMRA